MPDRRYALLLILAGNACEASAPAGGTPTRMPHHAPTPASAAMAPAPDQRSEAPTGGPTSPSADRLGREAPPTPPPVVPEEVTLAPSEVSSRFASLFARSAPRPYSFLDDVDPHDAEGPPFRHGKTKPRNVICRTSDPVGSSGQLAGSVECEDELGIAFTFDFAATREGLHRGAATGSPDIPEDGRAYRVAYDDGEPGDPWPCVRQGSPSEGGSYCVTVRCRPPRGYGPTLERFCVSPRGLSHYASENVEGPRIRRLSPR